MNRLRWRFPLVAVYITLVVLAAVITGPTIIRGADGLEIGALLMLGFPLSVPLAIAFGLAFSPISYDASSWAVLMALLLACACNAMFIVTYGKSKWTIGPVRRHR
jgi:membrane protease YdiL (CAAX protease family)